MPNSWRWISVCVPISRVSGPGGLAPSFRIPMVSKKRPWHVAQRMGTTPKNGSVESPHPRRGMMRAFPPVPRDSFRIPQRIGFPPPISLLSISTVSSSLHARFSVVFVSACGREGTVSSTGLPGSDGACPFFSCSTWFRSGRFGSYSLSTVGWKGTSKGETSCGPRVTDTVRCRGTCGTPSKPRPPQHGAWDDSRMQPRLLRPGNPPARHMHLSKHRQKSLLPGPSG